MDGYSNIRTDKRTVVCSFSERQLCERGTRQEAFICDNCVISSAIYGTKRRPGSDSFESYTPFYLNQSKSLVYTHIYVYTSHQYTL